jgi:hypothetical protein
MYREMLGEWRRDRDRTLVPSLLLLLVGGWRACSNAPDRCTVNDVALSLAHSDHPKRFMEEVKSDYKC